MSKIFAFVLFLILSGCCEYSRPPYVKSEDERIVDEILKKAATEIMLKTGLLPCGTGGQMMDKVKKLNLAFDYTGPIEIDKARSLLAESVDIFVAAVNADERVHPYLYNYPFEPKNVEIIIYIKNKGSFDVLPGELAVAAAVKGQFHYDIRHPETERLTTVHEETYKEAQARRTDGDPVETAVLQLPDHSEKNWKKISRNVNRKEGIVEVIPQDQTVENYSDLIAVQFMKVSNLRKAERTLEKVTAMIRKETLFCYPKKTATWRTIEESPEGITYEWTLNKPYQDIPIQHEISRVFLTPTGFHRVGFTRRHALLSKDEREKWIHLLRENSSVVLFKQGKSMDGFSLAEKPEAKGRVGVCF